MNRSIKLHGLYYLKNIGMLTMNNKNQLTTKKISQTIEKIEKRIRKYELKNSQIEYNYENSSYVIKTTSKNIRPTFINSTIEGLNLWIGTILINEQGFLNIELKEF